jgi:uncharacterized NAD(P)/FAD-binding protein YdhS
VIATSHPPPGLPAGIAEALGGDARLVADPWAPDALADVPPTAAVTIIGTGLTMADVVASLDRRGHTGQITAFSRRGQLSRGHAQTIPATPYDRFATMELPANTLSLLREVRCEVAAATAWPWQAIFDDLRANGQRIWQHLDERQRRQFLRHLRVYWDTHRYRIAPQAEAVIRRKRKDGSLRVLAAGLCGIAAGGEQVHLTLQPRHQGPERRIVIDADRVVVTTGPDHGSAIGRNPVLASLAAQGLITADLLGLGLAVDADSHAVQANGKSAADVLVVGPLARGRFGELMGLPQVAAHPDAVAAQLAARTETASIRLFA